MKERLGRLRSLRPAPWLLALGAGLAAALAHPPFGFLPGLLGYALYLHLVDQAPGPRPLRSAFWRGWLCGVGYFGLGVWWVAEAFLVDAETFGWMAPFAVILLAGGLALFWGLAGLVYRWIRPPGVTRVLVFAGVLGLCEWLRGHVLTGFAWNLPGETWKAGSPPSQFAAVAGAYGLTWITVAICAAPAVLGDAVPRRRRLMAVGVALAALAGLYVHGWTRTPALAAPQTGTRIRIVQPDVDQAIKYDVAWLKDIVGRYVTLTAQPGRGPSPDVIIWPEGAIPPILIEDLVELPAIIQAIRPGQTLIAGGLRLAPTGDGAAQPVAYNTLFVAHRQGGRLVISDIYDKHRLVPFGEFLPLERYLVPMGLTKIVPVNESFGRGPPPAPRSPPGLAPFQPLICYESLFPGFTRAGWRATGVRPRWIINISNDSWFGETSGPWQLLNLASYRAIEEGLPMVRATPTGISAVIDPYGRVCCGGMLGLGRRGVIDAFVPAALEPTIYARFGGFVFWAMTLISMLLIVMRHFVRRRDKMGDNTFGLRN